MKISSPIAKGNGAHIVHKTLSENIPNYIVTGYDHRLTLFPFLLKAAVKMPKTDLLHTTPDHAIFFMLQTVPSIITFHNYVLDPYMDPYSSVFQKIHYKTDLKLLTKMAVSRADTITAVSKYTAGIVKKDLNLNKNIEVIYNGIDSDIFFPASLKKNKKAVQVLFSGNLSKRKGAQWIPDIASKLNQNIHIQYTSGLRGDGFIKPAPNLIPNGSVPYKDMPDRYRQMDMLILPTVREGFSLAILEAMASGLPVVASDCSSISEQIDHGKGGFLCPVGDVNAFAERINTLADSPRLRKEMGEYNRAQIEKEFTLKKMVQSYKHLFGEVISKRR